MRYQSGKSIRSWEMKENDLICILMWFFRNQSEKTSLRKCSIETGVPYHTLYRYVTASRIHGKDNWFLHNVGLKLGYVPVFVGKDNGWLKVNKMAPYSGIVDELSTILYNE